MTQELEIWKDVVGYEGLYQVSTLGRVKGLRRLISCKNGMTLPQKERFMTPCLGKKGYLSVMLANHGKNKFCKIHRLVLTAFVENPSNKPHINHIDNNKLNNRLDNLEWCTPKENEDHKRKCGRVPVLSSHHKAIKVDQYTTDDVFVKTWNSIKEASDYYHIGKSNIGQCCLGLSKTSTGYKWEYN